MQTDDYLDLLTSQHRDKPKLRDSIQAAIEPLIDLRDELLELPEKYDIDTAEGDQLRTIGLWVGAPTVIPDAIALPLFGFDGQDNAQEFGDTSDPDVGGFWLESGLSGYTTATIDPVRYRAVIKAQIIKNQCDCTLDDAYTILGMVTEVPFVISDSGQMWIAVGLSSGTPRIEYQLMRVMFPKPAGVELRFFDNWIDGFGWDDQPNSLGFGDTSDPDVGGFWTEEI